MLAVFTSIIRNQEVVSVEDQNGGDVVLSPRFIIDNEEDVLDHNAFVSSAGSWSDIDIDILILILVTELRIALDGNLIGRETVSLANCIAYGRSGEEEV